MKIFKSLYIIIPIIILFYSWMTYNLYLKLFTTGFLFSFIFYDLVMWLDTKIEVKLIK